MTVSSAECLDIHCSASTFTAAQHPTLPPGYAYFYGGVGGMPGLAQYGGGVAGGGVYPPTHPGIAVPTAAGQTSTTQFQNKAAYGSSYGTSYDSLSLGQSSSGYVNKNYGSDNNQAKTGSSNNTAGRRLPVLAQWHVLSSGLFQAPQATGAQPFGKYRDQLYRW